MRLFCGNEETVFPSRQSAVVFKCITKRFVFTVILMTIETYIPASAAASVRPALKMSAKPWMPPEKCQHNRGCSLENINETVTADPEDVKKAMTADAENAKKEQSSMRLLLPFHLRFGTTYSAHSAPAF